MGIDRPIWFDGQRVSKDDLDSLTDALENEVLQRLLANTNTQGIVSGFALSNAGANTIEVSAGYGYTPDGTRAEFTPAQQKVIVGGDVGKYLVVQYSSSDGSQVAHPRTGALYDTRRTLASILAISAAPTDQEIILCKIDAIDTPAPGDVDYDESYRMELGSRIPDGFITDAMLAPLSTTYLHQFVYGTGTDPTGVNPHRLDIVDIDGGAAVSSLSELHQKRFHSDGIIGSFSALTPSIAPAPAGTIVLSSIPAGSYLTVGGEIFTSLVAYISTFASGGVNKLWLLLISSAGAFVQSLRASWPIQNITNVWLTGVSQSCPAGVFDLEFTTLTSELTWNNGSAVVIAGTGGVYRLFSENGYDWIEVTVIGALPGTDETNVVTVSSYPDVEDKAGMCLVCQTAAGTLVSGTVQDIRSIGTLNWRELSNQVFDFDVQQPLSKIPTVKMLAETVGNCVVAGFGISGSFPSATITVAGGIAWVNGKRLNVITYAGLSPATPAGSNYVFVTEAGVTFVSAVDLRNQAGKELVYLLLHVLQSSAGSFTSSVDSRNFNSKRGMFSIVNSNGKQTVEFNSLTLPNGPGSLVGEVIDTDNIINEAVTEDKVSLTIWRKLNPKGFTSFFDEFGGDGSLGDEVISVDTDLGVDFVRKYDNLTISAAGVLRTSSRPVLIIGVRGALMIESGGKIDMGWSIAPTEGPAPVAGVGPGGTGGLSRSSQNAGFGGSVYDANAGFVANGFTGGGSTGGVGGTCAGWPMTFGGGGGGGGCPPGGAPGGGGGGGGYGGNGGSNVALLYAGNIGKSVMSVSSWAASFISSIASPDLDRLHAWWSVLFSKGGPKGWGGGGAAGGSAGSWSGSGGGGGGGVYIECDELILPAGVEAITVKGGAGAGGGTDGGGGGGGAGTIFIVARTITDLSAANFATTGGAGGGSSTAGFGGAGSAGLLVAVDLSAMSL